MRIVKKLTNNKYLNLFETAGDVKNRIPKGFQYAERRGVDSVAFICMDKKTNEVLLNKEMKPPVGLMVIGGFGGSIDKDKFLTDIVVDEVREEAGFVVGLNDIKYVGKVLVSTQMNQYCYLYLVFVDKNKQVAREPENETEKIAVISWHSLEEINKLEDWKPIVIIEKAKGKKII